MPDLRQLLDGPALDPGAIEDALVVAHDRHEVIVVRQRRRSVLIGAAAMVLLVGAAFGAMALLDGSAPTPTPPVVAAPTDREPIPSDPDPGLPAPVSDPVDVGVGVGVGGGVGGTAVTIRRIAEVTGVEYLTDDLEPSLTVSLKCETIGDTLSNVSSSWQGNQLGLRVEIASNDPTPGCSTELRHTEPIPMSVDPDRAISVVLLDPI